MENSSIEMPTVTNRLRLGPRDASYAGNLVSGSKAMEIFADLETELSLIEGGDEGLCVGYDSVEFLAPLVVGDFVEAQASVTSRGKSSRKVDLKLYKVLGVDGNGCVVASAEPILVARASATIAVGRRFAETSA